MPRFYYRKQIRRAIRRHHTIPDMGQMLRTAIQLVAHEFGVTDYLCVLW